VFTLTTALVGGQSLGGPPAAAGMPSALRCTPVEPRAVEGPGSARTPRRRASRPFVCATSVTCTEPVPTGGEKLA
jgi:hypothetical protein